MKHRITPIALWVFFLSSFAFANQNGTGLQTSVAVDSVGQFNTSQEESAKDAFHAREAEFSFFAPIDHLFDGVLSLAAHREKGVYVFELHEATMASHKLIPGLSIKLGQYFLGLGRLNRIHRHDWPFVSAPKVFKEFFGSEGVLDSGVELSYLTPFSFYLDITAGATNGWTYGHAHNEGQKPKTPMVYSRIGGFAELGDSFALAYGVNGLQRNSSDDSVMQLMGFDATAKGDFLGRSFLVQSEFWQRQVTSKTAEKEDTFGAYLYPQIDISTNSSFGFRMDYYTVLSLQDIHGAKIENSEYAVVPTFTYKSSEFATFKLAYQHAISTQDNQKDSHTRHLEFQTVFILGAHPAHDF